MEREEKIWEEELVKKAKKKDVEAFALLYERISMELYRTAYYSLRNQQDAEDVVSETVLSAWSQIDNLREPAAFRAWMFKILSNRCLAKRKQYAENPIETWTDVSELTEEEQNQAVLLHENGEGKKETDLAGNLDLKQALKKLVVSDRMILILSVLEGYTTKEVAQMLNMKHATVRSRKSRALEKLAELLA